MQDAMSLMAPFDQPIQLRSVRIPNRIAMAPMTRHFSPNGTPVDGVAEYYRRRAAGGTGLIITEGIGIDENQSVDVPATPVLCGEERIAAWRRVTDAVRSAGSKIMPQLWHQGPLREAARSRFPDRVGLRPSGLWGTPGFSTLPDEYIARSIRPTSPMTDEQIADVIADYGRAAANAMAAGFDGIEIHGAHGYLIDAFFWSDTNRRNDRWGGSPRARAQFGAEVVRSIRTAIGAEKPIIFRFSQHKQQDYNARFAETPGELGEMLGELSDAGVDMFHASVRRFDMPAFAGSATTLSGWARKLTGKPSMTVGGIGLDNWLQDTITGGKETRSINNLPEVRRLFDEGMFDMFAVGRALISDPDWVRNARSGRDFLPFDKGKLRELA